MNKSRAIGVCVGSIGLMAASSSWGFGPSTVAAGNGSASKLHGEQSFRQPFSPPVADVSDQEPVEPSQAEFEKASADYDADLIRYLQRRVLDKRGLIADLYGAIYRKEHPLRLSTFIGSRPSRTTVPDTAVDDTLASTPAETIVKLRNLLQSLNERISVLSRKLIAK